MTLKKIGKFLYDWGPGFIVAVFMLWMGYSFVACMIGAGVTGFLVGLSEACGDE